MKEAERYKVLCDKIFAVDSRIRYAVVLDEAGLIVAGGMRPGVKSVGSPEYDRRVDFQTTVLVAIIKTWSEAIGPASFVFFKHKKINAILIPIGNKQLAVSTQPDFPLENVSKMLEIVERWKRPNSLHGHS